MALPRIFAALTSAQMSYLDDDFNAVGALVTIQATATGTNTITLTPAANAPVVSAYGLPNPVRFGFVAANTSSGPVSARANALAFLNVYLPNGVQADTGDIAATDYYEIVYNGALDSGNGGWIIVSALPGTGVSPAQLANAVGLSVTNNAGTPSTKIDITASKMVLTTAGGLPVLASSFSATCDLTTTGLNGMDTGARPTSGWVYIYALSNGTLTGCVATATSPTAGSFSPTPTGYIYSMYVGAMWLDGSQNLFRSKGHGRRWQHTLVAATNTATYPQIGTTASATAVAKSITTFVPLTAGAIGCLANTATVNSNITLSPNDVSAAVVSASNPSILAGVGATFPQVSGMFILESTNIYIAINSGGTLGLFCWGWEDYYVNA